MATYKEIITLHGTAEYRPEVFGLGEIYEIMSVERLRQRIRHRNSDHYLLLAANAGHSGNGITLPDLTRYATGNGYQVIQAGYVDSPCWRSIPGNGIQKKNYPGWAACLAKVIFFFLLRLEPLWQGAKRSHMVYVYVWKGLF